MAVGDVDRTAKTTLPNTSGGTAIAGRGCRQGTQHEGV